LLSTGTSDELTTEFEAEKQYFGHAVPV